MKSSILNFCWEFCYEVITADPKDDQSTVLILNLPVKFSEIIEIKLKEEGFRCVSIKLHGSGSVIARFKKLPFTVGN